MAHDLPPTARWGDARGVARRPLALALDGDAAVVLDAMGDLVRSRWSLADGVLLSRVSLEAWTYQATTALSPDGARAVCCRPEGRVEIWEGESPTPRVIQRPESPRPGAFSRDGTRLALWRHTNLRSVNAPLELDVLDVARGEVETSLRGCNYLAWSPDARSLVTHDGGLRRWNARDGRGPVRWAESVHDAAFVADDRLVLLAGTGELTFVRSDTATFVAEATAPHPPAHPFVSRIVHADERAVVVTSLGRRDGGTLVWRLDRASAQWLRLGEVACKAELVACDGKRVVAFDRNALVCWDVATGEASRWHRGFGAAVAAVAVRGPRVAAHDGAGDLRVFDAAGLTEQWALEPGSRRESSRPRALAFSHDARSLHTVTPMEGLVRWDLAAGALAATGTRVRSSPERLVIAPEGDAALGLARPAALDREPPVRRMDLRGEARWARFPAGALTGRRDALDARYVGGGRVHVLWGDLCQRETVDAVTGASLSRSEGLAWGSTRGGVSADGAFAALSAAQPDGARAVTWVGDAFEPQAHLGVASGDAQLVFAGARLVVCDGEDWGLWRREGATMARVAHLESGGCAATALAYDDATETLAVGTAEGTLAVFALGG